MQYNGGKEYLIKRHGFGVELERWCGQVQPLRIIDLGHGSTAPMCVFARCAPAAVLIANDMHPAISHMWKRAASGWKPPESLSEAEYLEIMARAKATVLSCAGCQHEGKHPGPLPVHTCAASQDPLVGFAGFSASFGGKYFAGYARPRPATPNPVLGQRKTILKAAPLLARVRWYCADYRDVYGPAGSGALYEPRAGDLVYFDKPYEGTTAYAGVPAFDHAACWAWLAELSKSPAVILVSEFSAPAGWRREWVVSRKQESKYAQAGGTTRVSTREDGLWRWVGC